MARLELTCTTHFLMCFNSLHDLQSISWEVAVDSMFRTHDRWQNKSHPVNHLANILEADGGSPITFVRITLFTATLPGQTNDVRTAAPKAAHWWTKSSCWQGICWLSFFLRTRHYYWATVIQNCHFSWDSSANYSALNDDTRIVLVKLRIGGPGFKSCWQKIILPLFSMRCKSRGGGGGNRSAIKMLSMKSSGNFISWHAAWPIYVNLQALLLEYKEA